jgi:hypothetical protein
VLVSFETEKLLIAGCQKDAVLSVAEQAITSQEGLYTAEL